MVGDACLLAVLGAASVVIAGGDGGGANCAQTSVGLAPINDLGAGDGVIDLLSLLADWT